jgi:hypothetical protein
MAAIESHISAESMLSGSDGFTVIGTWLGQEECVWRGGGRRTDNFHVSNVCPECSRNEEGITLIQQYYIDKDARRREENALCLRLNASNNAITQILLLNERVYTEEELGNPPMDKVQQVVVGKRLTYLDAFRYAKDNLSGYVALANTDMFFDKSIDNLRTAALANERRIFCQLRYEFTSSIKRLQDCVTTCLRPDSQDAWMWHSSLDLPDGAEKVLNFNMGVAGCDNKVVYLMSLLGIECYNEPERIRTYHYHESQVRTYDSKKPVPGPWYAIFPHVRDAFTRRQIETFDPSAENTALRRIVSECLATGEPFVIPRVAGVENNVAHLGVNMENSEQPVDERNLQHIRQIMKNNAGIRIDGANGIKLYSRMYLRAFHKSSCYFWWAPWGNVGVGIRDSQNFIADNFPAERIDAKALDVFHNIEREPWTLALRGKRLLIVSPFEESIRVQIGKREKIYGIDLFPECEFVFVKPPQTQGDCKSREFQHELADFVENLRKIKDTFDVALCSCGGYGNLVCAALHDMGKSAIYVGGVLQMYFGIYGERWVRERPDVLALYQNEHWVRPREKERPTGFEKVESQCYW